jgi:hypothetical protein
MNFKFKKENSLKNRQLKLQNFKNKFPDRIPLIIQKYKNSTLPEYQKDKFLVPDFFTMNDLINDLKKRFDIGAEFELILYFNEDEYVESKNLSIAEIYDQYKDQEDGFLYLYYTNSLIEKDN